MRPIRFFAVNFLSRVPGGLAARGIFCAALLAATLARGQPAPAAPELPTGPAPAWVRAIEVPATTEPLPAISQDGGFQWLLSDIQNNTAEHQFYAHFAYRISNASAVEDAAHLSAVFTPLYQQITWQMARVIRQGAAADRVASAEKQLLPVQNSSDMHTLDDRETWNLHLHDVQVGDVIEFAYTITGSNPILDNHWSTEIFLSWRDGIRRYYERVVHPSDGPAPLHWKIVAGNLPPTVTTQNGQTELVWDIKDMPPLITDDQVPSRFQPCPVAFLSDWQSWADVVTWGRNLFSVPAFENLPEPLRQKILEWRKLPTPEERAVAALEYVQDEIRYLAIPFGVHSYQPYPLSVVLDRRFGDCKDKTLLLTALLRELDIAAEPVLLSTYWESTVRDALPSPLMFDHAVVRLRLRPGDAWQCVDPTASNQRGPLNQRYFPDYGAGLVLGLGDTDLTTLKPNGFTNTRIKIREDIVVKDYQGPVQFKIETNLYGRDADYMRAVGQINNRAELEKGWLNEMAKYYPAIESAAPMQLDDYPAKDSFLVQESYSIHDFWKADPKDGQPRRLSAGFFIPMIEDRLDAPKTRLRTMPLALGYPIKIDYERHVQLPQSINLPPESVTVDSPYIHYHSDRRTSGSEVTFTCQYLTLAREVPPADYVAYQRDVEKIRDQISRTLWVNPADGAAAGANSSGTAPSNASGRQPGPYLYVIIAAGFLMFLCSCAGCLLFALRRRKRRRRPPELPRLGEEDLAGLGGWLVLIGIGNFIAPLAQLYGLSSILPAFSGSRSWWLADPAIDGTWALRVFFTFCLMFNLGMLPLTILKMVLYFQKRRHFPKAYLFFRACSLLGGLVVFGLLFTLKNVSTAHLVQAGLTIFFEAIGCAIWVTYMFRSRRVKLTFIR